MEKLSAIYCEPGHEDRDEEMKWRNARELNDLTCEAQSLLQQYRAHRPDSVLWTPLFHSIWLSDHRTKVFLKLETEQITNSFKVRGAVNRIHVAMNEGKSSVVTASTGNHAMAVVHAMQLCNAEGVIFLPRNAKPGKVAALLACADGTKAEIQFAGDDCLQAELAAVKHAEETSALYVSPYNDKLIMAGQGTIGVEILDTLSKLDQANDESGPKCCYVTVGGGGLISGVAACLKARNPGSWRVVGCLPYNSPVMYDCVRAGKVVDTKCSATLSDGSAGEIEEGSITVEFCRNLVDAWALINESDIEKAIADTFCNHRKVLEGAAAVAVAGFQKDTKWRNKNLCPTAVIVACGANIDPETFIEVVSKHKHMSTPA